MSLEQELLDATNVKKGKFKDRQKLLAAVVRAVESLSKDDYDSLSDEAVDWYDEAVEAMNKGNPVPELPDGEAVEDDEEAAEEVEEQETEDESEDDTESDEEAETQERDATDTAPEAETEDVAGDTSDLDEAKPKAKKTAKKVAKPKKAKEKPAPTKYDNLSGKKDRYGLYEGTIVSEVATFLEKGATMAEVNAKFGDTKYNLVNRLVKEGHHVEKVGPKFTLIHKDDWKGKKK